MLVGEALGELEVLRAACARGASEPGAEHPHVLIVEPVAGAEVVGDAPDELVGDVSRAHAAKSKHPSARRLNGSSMGDDWETGRDFASDRALDRGRLGNKKTLVSRAFSEWRDPDSNRSERGPRSRPGRLE